MIRFVQLAHRLIYAALRRLRRLGRATPNTRSLGRSRAGFLVALADASDPVATASALSTFRAAVAAGARLRAGLAWEWTQTDLEPATWRDALSDGEVDLVLVEISGGNVPGWTIDQLTELLDWSGATGIPAVAWVTGHYDEPGAANVWLDRVSHVFVTDEVDAWTATAGTTPVTALLPAAQPRVHSPRPAGTTRREQAVGLRVHGEPALSLEALATLPANRLDVWTDGGAAAAAVDAAGLSASRIPPRSAALLDKAIVRYSVFADVGNSPVPAWSVIEAGSSQTAIVMDESRLSCLPKDLHDSVTVARNLEELQTQVTARLWQRELRDREALRLSREVHARHTYANRVDTIIESLGLKASRPGRTVSAVVPTNRAHEIDNVLTNIARQAYAGDGGVELVLVLHGLTLSEAKLVARAKDLGVDNLTIINANSSLTLGACMNLGVEAASGDFIAKMDDDNFYGRNYLTDLVAAFCYTGAGIVGKWAHYVWLRSTGAVVLRCGYAEHRPERLVQGGSIVMRRDVARELPFSDIPRAVDTDLLNRAQEAGVMTYSADRFNFVSIRGADRHAHTWTISDDALMNRAGTLVFYGDPRSHVAV